MAEISSSEGTWTPDIPDPDPDATFVVESGTPTFTRRLTRSQKLQRGAVVMLAVAVAAFALLGGPQTLGALLRQPGHQVVRAESRVYAAPPLVHIAPPVGAATTPTLSVSPAPGADGAAYSCWVGPETSAPNGTAAQLHVALYNSHTHLWTRLMPPTERAARCRIMADAVQPGQALLSVYTGQGVSCLPPDLYFTSDTGAAWRRVAWPAQTSSACGLRLQLVGGRIYAQADTPLLTSTSVPGGRARLLTTGDLGATWLSADAGLPSGVAYSVLAVRPGGRLLVETVSGAEPGDATLWQSRDTGASWQSLGRLPGTAPRVYVSSDPGATDHGGWGRLYLSAYHRGQLILATSYPGGRWSAVPLPPADGSSGGQPAAVSPDTFVGPDGMLLLALPASSTVQRPFTPAAVLWRWNPREGTWLLAPYLMPANTLTRSSAWTAGSLENWLTVVHPGIPPFVEIVAFRLMSADRHGPGAAPASR
jgi:hypothetical protein